MICDLAEYKKLRARPKRCNEGERCWKALLLKPGIDHDVNEWELVRDHFEKSRSNKVLSIIQSKSPANTPSTFGDY